MKGSEELSDPISAALAKSSLSLRQWMDLFFPDTGKKGALTLHCAIHTAELCSIIIF